MFITLEGIEGSGKSTIIDRLSSYLRNQGRDTLVTREPGGSDLGKKLRTILLSSQTDNLAKEAELFLFLADRAQHVHTVIKPALRQGQIVLSDRFTDSTLAYQGHGRELELQNLKLLCDLAGQNLMPDLTLLLDLPVGMGLDRALKRNSLQGKNLNESRFDTESLDFHERVRKAYLDLAAREPARFKIINAANNLELVIEDCINAVNDKLIRIP